MSLKNKWKYIEFVAAATLKKNIFKSLFFKGTAVFDFSGTGYQVNGNLNAPKAITYSALIYCIRSLMKYDIPLNQVNFIFLNVCNRL